MADNPKNSDDATDYRKNTYPDYLPVFDGICEVNLPGKNKRPKIRYVIFIELDKPSKALLNVLPIKYLSYAYINYSLLRYRSKGHNSRMVRRTNKISTHLTKDTIRSILEECYHQRQRLPNSKHYHQFESLVYKKPLSFFHRIPNRLCGKFSMMLYRAKRLFC